MTTKNPINRSILFGCMVFIMILSLLLSIYTHLAFSNALYAQYQARLRDVITYAEGCVDVDDLYECVRTGVSSEKRDTLQQEFNRMVDDFELTYLYVVIPVDDETGSMINVISATNRAEREAGETDVPLLSVTSDTYSREQLRPYLDARKSSGISFFESTSNWGNYYTGCKPLRASDGEASILLCADYTTADLHDNIVDYVSRSALLIILVSGAFGVLLALWLRRNVVLPIRALERSALRFVHMSREAKNPEALAFDAEGVDTSIELKQLMDAFMQLSQEIKAQVEDAATAEERARTAEMEIEGMFRVAYQDALTRVKNKAAYDAKRAELAVDIVNERAQFALVMVDLNNLKKINDTYGHEKGNAYIVGGCTTLCQVYGHSPVYRIGGDEFVAVLQGNDLANREALFADLQARFAALQDDMSREPWERYSAAAGMAEYIPGTDMSADDVFKRADAMMYENKKQMKANRA